MRQIQVSHIRGYEDVKDSYVLYEDGTCININTNRFLKITLDNCGYPVYDLTKRKNNRQHKRYRIHRLLAQAFIPNPNNLPLVRHLNDDRFDWRLENLAWGTRSDNVRDSIRNNKYRNGYLKICKSVKCVETGVIYNSLREAMKATGIRDSHISECCSGKRKSAGEYHWEYMEVE